ncbi:MAG: T9SS type A sorting domain-containing protein [bacterium]
MKKNLIILLLIIYIIPGFAVYSNKPHDKGLLYLLMTNYGRFGYENQGIWPIGSGEQYIFGAGFWVGGLAKCEADTTSLSVSCNPTSTEILVQSTAAFDSAGVILVEGELMLHHGKTDTSFTDLIRGFATTTASAHAVGNQVMKMDVKVTVGYDASSGGTEFVPGDLPNEPGYTNPEERVLMTDDPADTLLWPLRDSLGNPIVRSKQDSYAILNDQDSTVCSQPLLMKVIQVGYAWDYHYYEDFIFLNYLVVNDGPDTIFHTRLAVNCDADIGDYTDDLIGFDAARDLGYAYDSDFYEPGWLHTPGFMGFDFLESPPDTLGQQIGLTAFKITHNPGVGGQGEPDPSNDFEAYQLIAGYNYTTGLYHPFDTITDPTDVRFLQCTGPFDFAPGETVKVVIAVIAGADTTDFLANDDLAQNLYNSNYLTHDITVVSPNGGEEISGIYAITWTDSSSTGAPLLVDISCSRDGGGTYQDVVTGIPDNHYYNWNTNNVPDGTRYLVRVTVHDTIAVGEDFSDSLFTVNNPGNGVPDVVLLAPLSGTLQGTVNIEWWANDADGDTLQIDIYAERQGCDWEMIAENLNNTGTYDWNTLFYHNGNYRLKIIAWDNDTCGVDSSLSLVTITNDHPPAAIVEHIQGGCNSLTLNCLLYNSAQLTGHTYEVRFNPIENALTTFDVYYTYDLWDVTTNSCLIEHCSLGVYLDGRLCSHYSEIVDGFALQFDIQVDMNSFRFIDFDILNNPSGFNGVLTIWGADSMGTAPPIGGNQWSFRGSDFIVRWKKYQPDTTKLTLEITDTTNFALIPYHDLRSDSWRFEPGAPSETLNLAVHKRFYVCGGGFWFNQSGTMTIPPDEGDVWQILSSGHRVPCNANVYRFVTTGINENSDLRCQPLFAVSPSIFRNNTLINLAIPHESQVNISIYNVLGQRVVVLLNRICQPGVYDIHWTVESLSSGIYFVRVDSEDIKEVKKVVLIK